MHHLITAIFFGLLSTATALAQSEPTIDTIAGSGNFGFSGDGGVAVAADLASPWGIAVDGAGNIYFGDYPGDVTEESARIRRVDSVTGVISTVAGGGTLLYPNDGELATDISIRSFGIVAVDRDGNFYFDDFVDGSVGGLLRFVDMSTGVVSTVAGGTPPITFISLAVIPANGVSEISFSATDGIGDNGPAASASLGAISDIKMNTQGNIYVAEDTRVRRIESTSDTITTIAGTGAHRAIYDYDTNGPFANLGWEAQGAYSTDGGQATAAGLLYYPNIALDGEGNLYIAEGGTTQVLVRDGEVLHITGQISYFNGNYVDSDTGTAYPSSLYDTSAVSVSRIRKVDAVTGVITTVAGTGDPGYAGDGGLATSASLSIGGGFGGLEFDPAGNLFVGQYDNGVVRRIDAASSIITTVAGVGSRGFAGDGGLASIAVLGGPVDLAFDSLGNLYITDYDNYRVRKITGIGSIPSTFTEAGENVVISPLDPTTGTTPVELTFANVTQSGQTSLVTSGVGPAASVGFKLGEPPVYFHLGTTAQFEDSVEVCFDYTSYLDRFGSTNLDLFHGLPGGTWEKITTTNDATNHILCGMTWSFSPFAIMEFAGPVADAGPDQSIHAGQVVHLDGGDSYSGNTPTESLTYAWTISLAPPGSAAILADGNTSTPSFVADVPGIYQVALVVTDLDQISSNPDSVQVSSLNQAPTSNAGANVCAVVGNTVTVDGTASFDPDHDALTYAWAVISKPTGSSASIVDANSETPSFTPDVPGTYTIELVVHDGFTAAVPSVMIITAITPIAYAEQVTMDVIQLSESLPPSNYTNHGNKRSFEQLLHEAERAMQSNNLKLARKKLQDAIDRTDGWFRTGTGPDTIGPSRDWVVDQATSVAFYLSLTSALGEIS